jgi:FlgD Ig-like domain
MKFAIRTALAFLFLLSATVGYATDWGLFQNDPNPFCNDPGSTVFQLGVAVEANVVLVVTNLDGTVIIRTLIDGLLQAGQHSIVWDGTDDAGALLSAGDYPYLMIATDPSSGDLLFEESLVCTIACEMAPDLETWGKIKSCFFDR